MIISLQKELSLFFSWWFYKHLAPNGARKRYEAVERCYRQIKGSEWL